jgi:hypothetical protein
MMKPIELTIADIDGEEVEFFTADVNYRNIVHKLLRYVLFPASMMLLMGGLACGIAAWFFIVRYPRTIPDGYGGIYNMNSQEYIGMYATGVVFEGCVLLCGLLILGLSFAMMRHEKRQAGSPGIERVRMFLKRFLSTILQVFLVLIFAYFITWTVLVSMTLEKWWTLTRSQCTVDEIACDRIDLGYKLFLSSSVLGMTAITALLMLNTAVLSHSGSMKIKTCIGSGTTSVTTSEKSIA